MMKNSLVIAFIILFLGGIWWFVGRRPYVTLEDYSDQTLVYHNPVWYGWDSRGLKWISSPSKKLRSDFPTAEGWWHVVYLTIPAKDLPPIDMTDPDQSIREWEKYYKWAPLGYKMPNEEVLVDR